MCLYDIRTGKAERRIVMNVSLPSAHPGRSRVSAISEGDELTTRLARLADEIQLVGLEPDITYRPPARLGRPQPVHVRSS